MLAERLVEIYKADEPDALTVVLEADGFADLLERTEFLERISDQDREIVDRVRALRDQAEKPGGELARLEGREQVAAETILSRRDDIADARDQLVPRATELRSVRNDRRGALAERARPARASSREDLACARAPTQARDRAAALQGAAAGPDQARLGRLIWPVNGPFTSPFGQRWGRLHAGIDIAAPTGHADPRRRLRAASCSPASTGGYGNYTCIQHTGSLSTCYGHQSSIATSSGAAVSQGQVIGAVRQHRQLDRAAPALRGPHQRSRPSTRWATSSYLLRLNRPSRFEPQLLFASQTRRHSRCGAPAQRRRTAS